MGAGQSTSHSHPPTRGLHVLRVTPSSPAFQANIEAFFDFVVGFEGDSLSSDKQIDASELEQIVESHENRTLNLLVWNSKSQQTRVVPIIPSRVWSQRNNEPQKSPSNAQPSLLGLSMRLCQPETASDNVWHVLDVLEGSPAESAGLVPMGDWILGWSGGVLSAENDFYDLVEAHVDKPLRVYVYSYDFDTLREVVLIPNRHWGGEGLLGCIFGFGLLHRIPAQPEDREPGTLPAELQEQGDEYGGQDLFVPADVEMGGGQHSPSQLAEWRQQEQEQWNREVLARSSHTQPIQTSSPAAVHNHHAHGPLSRSHATSQAVNSRPSSTQNSMRFSSTTDFSTPVPTPSPLGNSVNGRPPSLTPSLLDHSPQLLGLNGYVNSRTPVDQSRSSVAEVEDELDDGEASVAGTEDISHGSLTSVE